ncbi:hypothetical protein HUJ04_006380 [Dendroctonus ponderosae]|nr:hypothetical protein HUJ04_006380 [Dendroctonus ponderosae]KAH1012464.1 hypothetical protein HUJ05_011621 [Dendroctonus ponderosae]
MYSRIGRFEFFTRYKAGTESLLSILCHPVSCWFQALLNSNGMISQSLITSLSTLTSSKSTFKLLILAQHSEVVSAVVLHHQVQSGVPQSFTREEYGRILQSPIAGNLCLNSKDSKYSWRNSPKAIQIVNTGQQGVHQLSIELTGELQLKSAPCGTRLQPRVVQSISAVSRSISESPIGASHKNVDVNRRRIFRCISIKVGGYQQLAWKGSLIAHVQDRIGCIQQLSDALFSENLQQNRTASGVPILVLHLQRYYRASSWKLKRRNNGEQPLKVPIHVFQINWIVRAELQVWDSQQPTRQT